MIRDKASQAQVDAADPLASTWLSANAGSGKTRVLTDRVARLLLEKVDPQNILCLTYTKAAAAEMQNRLFKRLGAWAMMPDQDLRADLQKLGFSGEIARDELASARTLFARAIETPGGLKIQTIHSFCAGVLRRFPLEAGVSPQFREMEDHQAALLRAEVIDQLLVTSPAPVHAMMRHFKGLELDRFTAEIASRRDAFAHPVSDDTLRGLLELTQNITLDLLRDTILDEAGLALIRQVTTICKTGKSTDQKAAVKLANITGDIADLAILEDVFLTGKLAKSPYSAKIDSFPTKDLRAAHPDICDELAVMMETVQEARADRLALHTLEKTRALYDFAQVYVPAYEARKLAVGALDFDDLIRKTRRLLTDRALAQWVLFRLDGGIDHVLVDEAQDTSPDQWTVIKQLTEEFTAGEGVDPDRQRTIFVVGDKKQSIYSFQGADPQAFDQMKHHFAQGLQNAGYQLFDRSLDYSFRSSQAILRVVDSTFAGDQGAGLDVRVFHSAFKDQMPGRVDLWPVIADEAEEEPLDWTQPVDHIADSHVTVQMANRIAAQITHMMAHDTLPVEIGETGTYGRRKITEGDILILVQRRSDLFSEIIRACKAANLQVAGADRLRLGAELAVKDLTALLSFLALPEDDLSLAAALKSPLFGWDEQALFSLAHHRPEKGYLWAALRDAEGHQDTLDVLYDLRKQADFLRPYDLIARILTRHDGRRKLLARMGAEAEDGIDALLSQALSYESTAVPSITGFLSWMETDDIEIKRQMDSQGDQIRVMTVHGAKGLEAPIVFLPDTAKRENQAKAELFPSGDHVLWKMPVDESPPALSDLRDQIRDKQAEERMRLLYVAMTRAEKWLIVGAAGNIGSGDESWYNIIADGMRHAGDEDVSVSDLTARRVSHGVWDKGGIVTADKQVQPLPAPPQFAAVAVPEKRKTLSPSDLGGAKIIPGDPGGDAQEDALARGRMVHLLLEHLPLVPQAARAALGAELIASDTETHDAGLVSQVCALLETPALQHLFAPDALAEVGVTATLEGGARLHGTIDRLLVSDTHVLAVDYKTNRLTPAHPAETPEGILRQMGAYHAGLMQIFPNHRIELAILWTETAELMQIPIPLAADALARVNVA
jgi:ATP-dependent helicase/nuclease subunit A